MPFKHHGVAFAKRRRQVAVLLGAIAAVLAVILASGGSSGHIAPATAAAATKTDQGVYDYVNYTDGKAGPANPKLAPYVIGYTNTEGGSIPVYAPEATAATQWAVKYVNDHLGGIDGHPLKLETCLLKNSEQDGQVCAQQFLSNKKISLIAEGGVSVGGNTLDAVNNGKDVIIAAFGPAVNNNSSPNVFQLYTSADFSLFAFATYGKQVLHAKTNAVLYPDTPGVVATAQAIVQASKAEGMKTTLVTFDANSTDLVGALTAAKAQSADMITPIARSPSQCIAMVNGMHTLGINPNKAVGLSTCTLPTDAPQYWNKDFPTWTIGTGSGGDAYGNGKPARAWAAALKQYGLAQFQLDNWYQGMFGQTLSEVRFLNQVAKQYGGVSKITPARVAKVIKAFTGPLLLGGHTVHCGAYPKTYPNACTNGAFFTHYLGNGKWGATTWLETPPEIEKLLGYKP